MLSPGVETWSKSLHKVGFTRKARVLLGLQGQTPWFPASGPRRQGPWRLAPGLRKTSFCAFQKPCGLSPLARIKCLVPKHFGKHPEPLPMDSGTFPEIKHYYPHINLYFRTIPEFLVIFVISSKTPNNIRSPTYITHSTISSTNVKRADPTGSRIM